MNEFGVDFKEVEELGAGKFDVPNGHYLCIVESIRRVYFDWATDGTMKPGFYEYDDTQGLKPSEISYELKIQVIDGDYKGRQITQNLSTNNDNDTVAKIARSTLKSLFTSLNVDLEKGTAKDLINKPVMFEFGHYLPKLKPGESQKPEKLTIRKIYAKDSSPTATKVAVQQQATTPTAAQTQDKPGWGAAPTWSK